MHRKTLALFYLSEREIRENYELDSYFPHLTLSIVDGAITEETIQKMKTSAEEIYRMSYKFIATSLRVSKENPDSSYSLFEDILFKV